MALKLHSLTVLGSVALLLGACVITSSDDDPHPIPTGGSGGTGGTGGTAGTGGVGGSVGGQGGVSEGGAGGAGGAPCVDETGSGTTDEACNEMNITPEHAGGGAMQCGPNFDEDPLGYLVCLRGYEIYTAGQYEDLQTCLAEIGVQNACDEDPVTACLQGMYDDACPRAAIQEVCTGWADTCDPDPFDVDQCAYELNPFSDDGLQELVDCFNAADPNLSCQQAYDECFGTVSSV